MPREQPARLRVLLLAASMDPNQGGPPRVVYGCACALARAGHAIEIATTGAPGDIAALHAAWPLLAELGIPLHVFPRVGPVTLELEDAPGASHWTHKRPAEPGFDEEMRRGIAYLDERAAELDISIGRRAS